ncbi:homeotic protein female sterile [Ceratitis capitata]|uniref:homeotic protein female sterile n=1 Tax=Ceratitis capitata TaxID=7213 RepID=UPI0006189241|nr:homeotic protein female sterile [Ceratitis capitata]
MLKFLRIICIWICCAFCLLERIQLPAATAAIAAPFEYFEDHDQLSYDLDTEQSKAKYDTRLLSEQMLKSEKSTERYESADSHANGGSGNEGFGGSGATNSELDDDNESEADADVDDLQPHERAASCHNNGHKYTHGQKVPRKDPCEVCLCMDGEIFCWWELCTKKAANQIKSEHHASTHLDTSTVRLNEMSSTSGTTAHPTVDDKLQLQHQQQYQQASPYGNTLEMSTAKHEHLTEGSKSQQQQQVIENSAASTGGTKPMPYTTKSWQKKKSYQQQQKQKHEQQKQHQHKHAHEHAAYYAYPPPSLPVSASKILSFPENLPSVLYHDYRTEEHQHHQHQHHQQHLKHQQKKLQLQMQRQLQQQKQQQKQLKHKQHTHGAWKHEDDGDERDMIFTSKSVAPIAYVSNDSGSMGLSADWGLVGGNENVYDDVETDSGGDILPEPPTKRPKMTAAALPPPTTTTSSDFMTAGTATNGNMAASNLNRFGAATDGSTAFEVAVDADAHAGVGAQATGHVKQRQQQQQSNILVATDNEKSLKMNAADASSSSPVSSDSASASVSASNSTSRSASAAVVNAATPASATSTKITDKIETAELQQQDVFNRESSEEDQDDAFHRWLTSTEMNANNNNNNSSELDTTSPARRTNLFGLAGTQTINATSTAKTINNTNAPRGAGGGDRGTGGAGGGNRSSNNSKIENVYFRSSYNDYSSEYNGSVVNIDILLTTADEQQQAQQQQQKADLITQPSSSSQKTGERGGTTVSAAANSSSFSSTTALPTAAGSTQTSSPERQCNVMGTLYKIGDVLPQDTGNCLQCVCIEGTTGDDTPRVTCSPHNCPPLVLPDLFDATGY